MNKCPFHRTDTIREFDALDEEARANPWPYYDWLRDDELRRVYPLPREQNFYMVHRYEDVKAVLSDAQTFSSKIIPSEKIPFFVMLDGEEHERIRSIVAEIFSPAMMEYLTPHIHQVVRETTSGIIQAGEGELFSSWADVIPLRTLSLLFGFPKDDESISALHHDAIAINRALFVTGGTGPRRNSYPVWNEKMKISGALLSNGALLIKLWRLLGTSGLNELRKMFSPPKSSNNIPRPSFEHIPQAVRPLLRLAIHFAKLMRDDTGESPPALRIMKEALKMNRAGISEMIMAGSFILFAGYETTSSLLSNAFVHLVQNPALFSELKKNPGRIDSFIEECLRFYTPVGRFLRMTTRDVFVGEQMIPAGSIIIVMNGAANTDPVRFENGCTFDISRTNARQHLSFGKGTHYCVGAPLARMQIQMALQQLVENAKAIHVNPESLNKMVTDRDNGILRYERVYFRVEGE
jgi:cytochrome P450